MSLVEVVIAAAIVVTIAGGVAHLLVWSRTAAASAERRSIAVALAVAKVEQLRALEWSFDEQGGRLSDTSTNLSNDPQSADGTGLRPSPAGSLVEDTPGFVDFTGADGVWRGTGRHPPAGAVFVRRWAVAPYPLDPEDTLLFIVAVAPVAALRAPGAVAQEEVRVRTLRTRLRP